jgi:hypothetical protein
VYASKALFLFLVAKFHTSRTTTKGSIANGTKDSFAKEKQKLQSHYWLRLLAWAYTTSLRRHLLVFFLVAKFYTSATTTTRDPSAKDTKAFFGAKKKLQSHHILRGKKGLKLSYLDDIFIPPMGHQNKLGFFFSF